MNKYRVDLEAYASLSITVEADDPDAAIQEAYEQAPTGVCGYCSGWGQSWSLELGEWYTPVDGDGPEMIEGDK